MNWLDVRHSHSQRKLKVTGITKEGSYIVKDEEAGRVYVRQGDELVTLDSPNNYQYLDCQLPVLQSLVAEFTEKTFSPVTVESRYDKAKEEFAEFLQDPNPDEAADVLIVLLAYAAACNFNLFAVTLDKFERVRNAQYVADEDGIVRRVKDAPQGAGARA